MFNFKIINMMKEDLNDDDLLLLRDYSSMSSILKQWCKLFNKDNSLKSYNLDNDYLEIERFSKAHHKRSLQNILKSCRNNSLTKGFTSPKVHVLILRGISMFDKEIDRIKKDYSFGLSTDFGQSEIYSHVTRKLYKEHLKIRGGQKLKSFDVTLEHGKDARTVRKIVEKRMSQACHRILHHKKDGNKLRHDVRRAVSYQMFNLGQIEDDANFHREEGSHWKSVYDDVSNTVVFKKKVEYDTYEQALEGIMQWHVRHPEDKREISAYLCTSCHKYHIGHSAYCRLA
jgi:hypothetical protein